MMPQATIKNLIKVQRKCENYWWKSCKGIVTEPSDNGKDVLRVKRGSKIIADDVQNLCFYKISPNKWMKTDRACVQKWSRQKENIAKMHK